MEEKDEYIFYVYVYLDPRKQINKDYLGINFKHEPFYVGKGHNSRKDEHIKEHRQLIRKVNSGELRKDKVHRKILKIDNILKAGKSPIIEVLDCDLSEEDAFTIEEFFIEEIGRVEDGGTLFNYRTGGISGGKLGESSKSKISTSLKEYYKNNDVWNKGKKWDELIMGEHPLKNINLGKKQSKKTIQRRSNSLRKAWKERGNEIVKKRNKTLENIEIDFVARGKKISKIKKGNVVISEEQKKRNSETLKKKYKSGEIFVWNKGKKMTKEYKEKYCKNKHSTKRVIQFTTDGQEVNRFISLKEAHRCTKVIDASISVVCLDKGLSAGGYIWVFESDYVDNPNILDEKVLKYKLAHIKRVKTKKLQICKTKPVQQLDDKENVIRTFYSSENAKKIMGGGNIVKACTQGTKSKGFYWRYK